MGVEDAAELSRREDQLTAARQAILLNKGLKPPFDFDKLKTIHRQVFQDVYEWAGKPRNCDLRKAAFLDSNESPKQFTPSRMIEAEAERIFGSLTRNGELCGLSLSDFTESAAELFVEINNLHAFREGNGRTQRIFLNALAKNAGHELAFDVITRERMIDVSVAGLDGDIGGVRRLFREISNPRRVEALRKALRFLKEAKPGKWNDLYVATTTAGQDYAGILVGKASGDFMMWVSENPQDWIAIGDIDDLPENLSTGDKFEVTPKRF